ncbi:glycoside hydrolase family 16 protein [Actinocorallia longicatena]|uniref:GH16 domain-containing protein n=1 Tax=Actinocorallia longicatena TaxID=111803 RepID=A0ABP6QGR7_9ACTN
MRAAERFQVTLVVGLVLCALLVTSVAIALQPGDAAIAPFRAAPGVRPTESAPIGIDQAKINWKLAWREEFNGAGAPDPARWNVAVGNGINGYGHKALQYYDRASAVQDGKGSLVLTARPRKNGQTCWYGPCAYTSGRIDSKGKISYGYGRYTARMRTPTGVGLWPAFWLQTVATTEAAYSEIDVLETIGNEPNRVQGFAHTLKGRVGKGELWLDEPLSAGYHVYGADWTPTEITWTLDGRPYAQLKRYKAWPFTTPMFLILNLQVGGEWPGKPDAATRFPARMHVDWIRIYKGTA